MPKRDMDITAIDGLTEQSKRELLLKLLRKKQSRQHGTEPAHSGKAPENTVAAQREVAVIGISCIFAGAENADRFWDNLAAGVCSIREVPEQRWSPALYYDANPRAEGKTCCKWGGFIDGADLFDPLFFNISPLEAEKMDPQQRLVLEHAWKTFDDAGYARERLDNANCGIYVGVMNNDYVQRLTNEYPTQEMMGRSNAILASRISFLLNLKGPAMMLDTACSSSLVALHLARNSILAGETEMMLAGGVTLYINPESYIMMSKAGMLSPSGSCIAFDASANGFVPGEGVGMLLLKRLDRALHDGDYIYGVIKGSGTNQDGKTNGITAPNPAAQQALQLEVFQRSGVSPDTVSMAETHGTGTPLGDPIEIEALRAAFGAHSGRQHYCALGAVKNNIGHASAAAGIAGVIKVLKSMENARIPALANFTRLNEEIELEGSPFYIPSATRPWTDDEGNKRRATVSSYGFSGTNSFVILEQAPPSPYLAAEHAAEYYAIPVSARTEALLRVSVKYLADKLARRPHAPAGGSLQAVANTLYYEKNHERFRVCFLVRSERELLQALADFLAGGIAARDIRAGGQPQHPDAGHPQQRPGGAQLACRLFAADFQHGVPAREDYLRFVDEYHRGVDAKPAVAERPLYQRVPLPIVAFDRQSYWIARPQPALPAPVSRATGITLRGETPWLRDHQVDGVPTLPATAYLELIAPTGSESLPVRYHKLEWRRLVQVAEGPVELDILRERHGSTETCTFYLRGEGGERGAVTAGLEREAPAQIASEPFAVTARDIGEFQQSASFVFERDELKQFFEKSGLHYGASFDCLQRVHRRGDELLGELARPPAGAQPFSTAGILDAALRIAGLLYYHDSANRRIPLSIACITQTAPAAEAACAYVSRRGANLFDIEILNRQGRVFIRLESVQLAEKPRALKPVFYLPGERDAAAPAPGGEGAAAARVKILTLAGGAKMAQRLQALTGAEVVEEPDIDAVVGEGTPDITALDAAAQVSEVDTVYLVIGGEARSRTRLLAEQLFLLDLARHLQKTAARRHLVLLTRAAAVVPGGATVDERAAAFIGLVRVIANEFSTLNVIHFDLAADEPFGEPHLALVREAERGTFNNTALKTYRLSSGKWRHAVTLPATVAPLRASVFRHGGTYLIAGGAGGIGYELALYLGGRYGANLVLLGRRREDEAIRRKLRLIEAVGGSARYYACDVTCAADVREKVAQPEAAIGPLHGVVNSAVVFNDRSIARMEPVLFEETFNSKYLACQTLFEVFGSRELDFMLFFSSTQSFVGNPGQSNYGAGSTFKDAFAHNRNLAAAYPVKTINWGYWGSVGAVAAPELNDRLRSAYGLEPLEVWEGLEAIERVLASEYQQVIVAKPGERGAAAMGVVAAENVPAPVATAAGSASVKAQLKKVVGDILRIAPEKLDEAKPFTEYGLDSVVGVSLANRLNDVFETELNPTAFFDYINVRQLAEHIGQEREGRERPAGGAPAHVPPAADTGKSEAPAQTAADVNLFDEDFDLDTTAASVVLERPGGVGQIKLKPVAPGAPQAHEIQIKVHAFALNFGDLLCVRGLYPTMPRYPFTPGFEASGTVVATGAGVTDFQPGDEVIALFGDGLGGHSTLVNTSTDYVVPKPANVSHEQACAFGVVFVTMAYAFERAQVKPGETVLIQTAAGGVGLVSVQMAQRAGADIFATAGSRAKLDYLQELGVKHLINYREEDFQQKILALTGGRGVDVVINTLSGEAVQKGLDILAPGGRYIEIAPVALKSAPGFNLSRLTDNQTLISIDMRRLMLRDKHRARHYLRQMTEALLAQTVLPTVSATYSLAQIREAYRHLESRDSIGKIVVRTPGVQNAPLLSAAAARVRFEAHPWYRAVAQRQRPAHPHRGQNPEIAIIGMAGMFAGAADLDSFWNNLARGVASIGEIPASRWPLEGFFDRDREAPNRSYAKWGGFLADIDQFDPVFFGLSGKEASVMDPQQRLFLQTCWNALDYAGYASDRCAGTDCSVFVGVGESEYKWRMEAAAVEKQAQAFWSNEASVLAARVSYFLDLKGASVAVNTACSSSLVAVELACNSLAEGASGMAIAGGVSVYNHPGFFILASKAGMLSDDGCCRAFDDAANGFVPGEGVGAIVLKRLDAALRDGDPVVAKIIAHGVNQDGKTNGITAPNGQSQQRLLESMYRKFGVDPSTISYVEAHGTGTRLGDPIEVNALAKAFRQFTRKTRFCGIGSVKTNVGHATTAAGIAGILKVLLALQHRKLPPTLNFRQANKLIALAESPFYVTDTLSDWAPGDGPRRAAVSSFSFSGTNAHLVIEEAPGGEAMAAALVNAHREAGRGPQGEAGEPEVETDPALVLISASNAGNLRAYAQRLSEHIRAAGEQAPPLENLAYTSQVHRRHLSHRRGFFAATTTELLQRIDAWLADTAETPGVAEPPPVPADGDPVAGETLARWLAERNLEAVCRAWEAGSEVDWGRLYTGRVKRKVPMPPHIFNQKRYWFEASPRPTPPLENESRVDAGAAPVNRNNHPTIEKKEPEKMGGINERPKRLKLKSTGQAPLKTAAQTASSAPVDIPGSDASRTAAGRPQSPDSITAELKAILAGILLVDAEDIAWHKNFSDLGVDSIMGVEFVKGINRVFGTNLSASLIFDYPYLQDLAAHIRPLLPPAAPVVPAPEEEVPAHGEPQARQSAPGASGGSDEDITAVLKTNLAGILLVDAEDIAWHKNFSDLGVDSIMGVEFVKGINRDLGTNLSASLIFDYPYLKELATHIRSLLPPASPAAPAPAQEAGVEARGIPRKREAAAGKSDADIAAVLKTNLAGILLVDAEDIAWHKNFSDLGVDSIMGVEFVKGINRDLGTNLSASLIFDYPCLKELTAYIRPLVPQVPAADSVPPAPASEPNPRTDVPAPPVAKPPVHPGGIGGNLIGGSSYLSEVSWQTVEVREPLDNEIRIDVLASGINFADILCVKGMYPAMPAYPFVSGFEVAGIVRQTGSRVRSVRVGDPVVALTGLELGGHADAVNVKEGYFVKKPENLSFSEAASLPIVFCTAYYVLVNLAQINAGDLVLIQIAAGGVGQMAVALAKKFGARVIGTSSSEEKLAYLRATGVDFAINYQAPDFSEQVRAITGGRGVDIVLNSLGGEFIQKGLNALAPGGRYVELAVAGLKSAPGLSLAGLANNQSFFSFDLRRFSNGPAGTVQAILEQMNRYFASGELAPPPIKEFDSLSVREALEYLAARRNTGKVVLLHKSGGGERRAPTSASRDAAAQPPREARSAPSGSVQNPGAERGPRPKDIAVIGMSGRFPGAKNVGEFWCNLASGVDAVGEVPPMRWDVGQHFDTDRSAPAKTYSKWGGYLDDVDKFDPSFFNLTPREAELMDPQHRLFLQEAWKAVEDAGYSASAWSQRRCGVFVGANPGDYVERLRSNARTMNSELLSGNTNSMLPARPAYFMNLKGPAVTIDTACSSSLMAVHQACVSILSGECETAIAGGVSVLVTPEMHILTSKSGMLSKDGKCKTFDNAADGFVQGEGVGVVVLKPLAQSLRDKDYIYGVIKASGANQDGKSNGIMAPSSLAQSALQTEVYRTHGIDPDAISYIEAHGTGTKLGDPIEIEALSRSLGSARRARQSCPVGSVKTNIGHALAAAGITGLIKVLLSLKHRELVPSLHYRTANEHIRFEETPFYVNTGHWAWNPPEKRLAAINSFGFSGTNCHLVVEEAPARETVAPPAATADAYHVVPFSSVDALSLRANLENLKQWLETASASIELIASVLRNGREHFEVRAVALVRSREELQHTLERILNGELSDCYFSQPAADIERELPRSVPVTDYRYCRVAAQWYLEHRDFQWREFFPVSDENKVPLPTYEFLSESYWIDNPRQHWQTQAAPADDQRQEQALCIDSDDYVIGDHVINRRRVVPGAALVSAMVSRLLADGEQNQAFSLRRIQWHRQFIIAPEQERADLVLRNTGSRQIEIFSAAGTPEPVRQASAEIDTAALEHADVAAELRREFNLEGLRSRCREKISNHEIYPTLSGMGIQYGPSFQVLEKCYFNQRESIAYLEAPAREHRGNARLWIVPALLDGALQSVYGIKSALPEYREMTMVPVAIENLRVFKKMPASLIVVARLRGVATPVDGAELTYDLLLLDEFEQPVLCIRGYRQKAVYGGGPGAEPEGRAGRESGARLNTFRTEWQVSSAGAGAGAALAGKNVLIAGAGEDFAGEFVRRLPDARIARVAFGPDYREANAGGGLFCEFDISPHDADAWPRVVERLAEKGFTPDYVLFLMPRQSDIRAETLAADLRANILSQFSLLKALLKTPARENLDYLCLCETETAGPPDPLAYGLNGFFKSLNRENPRLRPKLVFLAPANGEQASAGQAVSVGLAESGFEYRQEASTILWEGDTRLIRGLREFPLREAPDPGSRPAGMVAGGTYLISGGLGHIGRAVAEHLARHYRAAIALVGRRALAGGDKAFIDSLNAAGARASYFQGDIADIRQSRRLVGDIRKTLGEIDGVFHSAGVLCDRHFIEKESAEFLQTLRPKVAATLALHEALSGVPLAFFALFSSTAGHTGNQAQCDYAYANSFLDGFAPWRNRQVERGQGHFGHTLSLGWALWEAGGMYIESDKVRAFIERDIGMLPLPKAQAVPALQQALLSGEPYWMLINGYAAKLRTAFGAVDKPPTAAADRPAAVADRVALPATPWTHERLKERTQAFLIDTVSETLKLPKRKITLQKTFDKYGIDSVVIMELNRILERHFPDLPKTLFFEYNTIEGMSDYFVEHHAPSLRKLLLDTSPVAVPSPARPATATGPLNGAAALKLPLPDHSTAPAEPHAPGGGSEPIAIIGVSGRYPKADDLDEFWHNLAAGVDCIEDIPPARWDYRETFHASGNAGETPVAGTTYSKWGGFINGVDEFDPLFFTISPREAEYLDPQERLFLQCAWHTVEDAGYKTGSLGGSVGVFVGVMWGQYQFFGVEESLKTPSMVSSSSYSSIANRVSYCLNLKGPSMAVDSMCSSSLTAIHLACQAIRAGECECALAGGVNVTIHPNKHIQLSQGKFASSDGRCRSFGAGGDGYVPGEGVGAVLLKPLFRALSDRDYIYAAIRGSALNHAGKTHGYTVPSPNAQAQVIRAAIERAGVEPQSLQYIEAHGTGTALGDPIEISGLAKALPELADRPDRLPLGSVKSMVGHLESAAGIAGLTKLLLQLKHRQFAASLHAQTLNPNIDFEKTPFRVQREPAPWPENVVEEAGRGPVAAPRRAALSSFGAGGANAHFIIEEGPAREAALVEPAQPAVPFPVSARSGQRLKSYVENLVRFIERNYSEPDVGARANAADPGPEPWRDLIEPLQHTVAAAVAESLGVNASDLSPADRLDDYGVDALAVTQMERSLVQTLKVKVSLQRTLSLRDNVRALARRECDALRQRLGCEAAPAAPVVIGAHTQAYLNLAYTFQTAREAYAERLLVLATDLRQLHRRLQACLEADLDSDRGDFLRATVRNDSAAGEALARAHRNRDARALAECWINGGEVDWNVLYPAARPLRVPAPGYPFARDRYWMAITPRAAFAPAAVQKAGRHAREGLQSDYTAPRTDLEKAVAEVWEEVLGIGQLGLYDDLFELGGNSIASMDIIARLRPRIDIDIKLGQFMEASTVAAVARLIEQAGGSLLAAPAGGTARGPQDTIPAPRTGEIIRADMSKTRFPLSLGQTRFWFLNTLNPDNPVYHLTTYVEFRGPELDVPVFEQSYRALLQRHGALRTRFVEDSDGIAQIIEAAGHYNLEWVDLRGRAVSDADIKALTDRETMQPLDFSAGCGHKLVIYRIAGERFGLYLKTHHILSDAWSLGIFIQELIELYSARIGGRAPALAPADTHFGHYSEWSGERLPRVLESQLPYWVEKLKGIPQEPSLPLDYRRPERGIFAASHLTFHLDKEQLEQLEGFSRKNKASLFVTLLTAFNAMLNLVSRQEDMVIGFPVANRSNLATENMLGFLANTLVLRTDLSGNPSVADMIDRVRQVTYGAFDHSEVPFAKIVEAIRPRRAINFNPVFQVMFNMIPDLALLPQATFEGTLRDDPPAAIDFDLMLRITQKRNSMLATLHYAKDLFSAATAQAFADRFLHVLEDMVRRPDARLRDLGQALAGDAKKAATGESARLVVSSTFTIDPIVETLNYWSEIFEQRFDTVLAPYNQVYNQLLDPGQETLSNAGGINLMIIKFDDWTRASQDLDREALIGISERAFEDFTASLQQADSLLHSPLLLVVGPSDCGRLSHPQTRRALYRRYGRVLAECVRPLQKVTLLSTDEVAQLYGVRQIFDPGMDANGHIPYTFDYFRALGTAAFRGIHSLIRKAHKAIVLDCDHTLWRGVLGEEGIDGIVVDESRKRFQRKLIEQVRAGVLLCLCSKNDEEDVLNVFREHPDMELRLEHIVAQRVNWKPKPENIVALAEQLNLAPDSFIFIDDNPVECEQMRALRPEVLTLKFPESPADIERFVAHAWFLDHHRITREDGARTRMMQENIAREAASAKYSSFAAFIDSLNLEIRIEPAADLNRASQLLARTNQFNAAGVRLSLAELETFDKTPGNSIFSVHVKDRFGDYGLVGCLLLSETEGESRELNLVNMVLSCRTLGKGVEHRMLQHCAQTARQRGIGRLSVDFKKTDRNKPVLDFLFSLREPEAAAAEATAGRLLFATRELLELKFDPTNHVVVSGNNRPIVNPPGAWTNLNRRLAEIAEQGIHVAGIAPDRQASGTHTPAPPTPGSRAASKSNGKLAWIRARRMTPDMRRALFSANGAGNRPADSAADTGRRDARPHAATGSAGAQETVAGIFQDVMGGGPISLTDNYFDIGVQSMDLVKICARLQDTYRREVPIELMFQYTTIRALAAHLGEPPTVPTPARLPLTTLTQQGVYQ